MVASTGVINAELKPASAIDASSATVYGSTLPAGWTLSQLSDGTGAKLVGSVAAPGFYEVAVRVVNDCGVGAAKAFTIVVTVLGKKPPE